MSEVFPSLYVLINYGLSILSLIVSLIVFITVWRMMRATESIATTTRFMLEEMSRRDSSAPGPPPAD